MSNNKLKSVRNRDVFIRMNYLYQASMLMAGTNNTLSSYYGALCKNIGKKSVLRMEPDMKRTICKKCGLALKPGITSEIGIDEKNRNLFTIQCKQCNFKKNFLINPKYTFWLENPESVADQNNLETENETLETDILATKKLKKDKKCKENKN